MVLHPITIEIPDELFALLQRRAAASHRSLDQELLSTLSAKLASDEGDAARMEKVLDKMRVYSDSQLLAVVRDTPSRESCRRSEYLNSKQRESSLTPAERVELESLMTQYDWHVLLRAKALALLNQRGHDVNRLLSDEFAAQP